MECVREVQGERLIVTECWWGGMKLAKVGQVKVGRPNELELGLVVGLQIQSHHRGYKVVSITYANTPVHLHSTKCCLYNVAVLVVKSRHVSIPLIASSSPH